MSDAFLAGNGENRATKWKSQSRSQQHGFEARRHAAKHVDRTRVQFDVAGLPDD
jgi:hypothetical protein